MKENNSEKHTAGSGTLKNRFTNNSLTSAHPSPPKLRRWLPHPLFSLGMVAVWMLLNNTTSAGHLLLGIFLSWMIPWLAQGFWPEPLLVRKPLVLIRFAFVVLWDVVIANLVLMVRILGPSAKLQPAFIKVPLDTDHEFAIAMLASTISLTPGTVSADLSLDGHYLLVHCLHVRDIEEEIQLLKTRYEAPLKEIFNC
jgi:multicomponent K+:H+ antiporter subunit E